MTAAWCPGGCMPVPQPSQGLPPSFQLTQPGSKKSTLPRVPTPLIHPCGLADRIRGRGQGGGLESRLCAGALRTTPSLGPQPPAPLALTRPSKAAPPTRHDLHWGQKQEPTRQTGSGCWVWGGSRPSEAAAADSGGLRWVEGTVCAVSSAPVHGGGAGGQGAHGI